MVATVSILLHIAAIISRRYVQLTWRISHHRRFIIFLGLSSHKYLLGQVDYLLKGLTNLDPPKDPTFHLLHHNRIAKKRYPKSLLPQVLSTAKSCIADYWKSGTPPKMADCVLRISNKFWEVWLRWVDFITTKANENFLNREVGDLKGHGESLIKWPTLPFPPMLTGVQVIGYLSFRSFYLFLSTFSYIWDPLLRGW